MDTAGTIFLPPGSSTLAGDVDALFYFLVYASIAVFGIVVFALVFFIIRYRHRRTEKLATTQGPSHSLRLELLWSIIPTILVIIVFVWGFRVFIRMHVVPKDAMEIKVTGQKWFWSFDYPEGIATVNELVVPVGKPVKLLMSSSDVIHSFFVPHFRIKMDVLPNRYTVTWFEAIRPGNYDLFCAEFCGDGHSDMIGKVRVVSEREFAEWLETGTAGGEDLPPEQYGASLFVGRACHTCHSVEGQRMIGPALNGIFGKEHALASGERVIADENYLRESILEPQAKIVAGYEPVMPTYQGLLNDRQIDALIAYLKSLE